MIKNIKLMTILSFFTCLLGFFSCSSSDGEPEVSSPVVSVVPTQITATYEGSVTTLSVKSDQEWTAFSNEDWITCKILSNTLQGTVEVTVKANTTYQPREGAVVVKLGTTRVSVPVSQEAKPDIVDPDIDTPEGYRLIWQDEFNDSKLSTPDESLWWYETGVSGWGNNEIQNYIPGSKNGETCAQVSNGTLKIIAKKVGNEVYSIRMNTVESWKYGYFEARLKLPTGKGTWPAFWMMPKNYTAWPDDGEIDIMEEVGYDPNVILSTVHCKAYNHSIGTQKSGTIKVPTAQTEFHVYAVEWTEDFIKGYVDGKCYFTFDNDKKGNKNTWPFNTAFYLKLNLAWGGDWGGAQGIDESALPATYEIDYVRVFQKKIIE